MVFQGFRRRKTPVRNPSFCKDFREEAARHEITSQRATEEFSYATLPLVGNNPPYATFLFLSAARAYFRAKVGWGRACSRSTLQWLRKPAGVGCC